MLSSYVFFFFVEMLLLEHEATIHLGTVIGSISALFSTSAWYWQRHSSDIHLFGLSVQSRRGMDVFFSFKLYWTTQKQFRKKATVPLSDEERNWSIWKGLNVCRKFKNTYTVHVQNKRENVPGHWLKETLINSNWNKLIYQKKIIKCKKHLIIAVNWLYTFHIHLFVKLHVMHDKWILVKFEKWQSAVIYIIKCYTHVRRLLFVRFRKLNRLCGCGWNKFK